MPAAAVSRWLGGLLALWTVVYVAPNREVGERLKARLEGEGLLVVLRPTGVTTEKGSTNYEIMVPKSEVQEAQEALSTWIGR